MIGHLLTALVATFLVDWTHSLSDRGVEFSVDFALSLVQVADSHARDFVERSFEHRDVFSQVVDAKHG